MTEITIRELRDRGGEVIDRVARGEQVTITRAGQLVAELRPVGRRPLTAEMLLARWRRLPAVDYRAMRAELDEALDAADFDGIDGLRVVPVKLPDRAPD